MTAVRFTRRAVTNLAVRWDGRNVAELVTFTGDNFRTVVPGALRNAGFTGQVFDVLHDSWVGVRTGQWIMRGVKGEHYPVEEEVLEQTYRRTDAGPAHALEAVSRTWLWVARDQVNHPTRARLDISYEAAPLYRDDLLRLLERIWDLEPYEPAVIRTVRGLAGLTPGTILIDREKVAWFVRGGRGYAFLERDDEEGQTFFLDNVLRLQAALAYGPFTQVYSRTREGESGAQPDHS